MHQIGRKGYGPMGMKVIHKPYSRSAAAEAQVAFYFQHTKSLLLLGCCCGTQFKLPYDGNVVNDRAYMGLLEVP